MSDTHPDCPFCLENNTLQNDIIAESHGAFLIKASSSPGNYLLIPKTHVESVLELADNWWGDAKPLLAHVPGNPEAYNVSLNIGHVAGQRVPHLHFWIIPRSEGQPSSHKGLALLIREANNA